jgi:hypothetical protein
MLVNLQSGKRSIVAACAVRESLVGVVIQREPSLPICVGNTLAILQRLAEWR